MLLSPAYGFSVPDGTPDGIYRVELDASGQEIHTRAEDLSSRAMVHARAFSMKRDGLDQWGCINQQTALDHGDADRAVKALREQIGGGGRSVGGRMGLYSISGEVVVYCCNNRDGSNTCYLSEQSNSILGVHVDRTNLGMLMTVVLRLRMGTSTRVTAGALKIEDYEFVARGRFKGY